MATSKSGGGYSLARLVLTEDEAAVCAAVGVRAFVQARSLVARGDLVDVVWDRQARRGHAVVRGGTAGWVTASVVIDVDGAIKSVHGVCTCDSAPDCAHPAALVLIAHTSGTSRRRSAPSWESALAVLVGADSPPAGRGSPDLALQFDLDDGGADSERRIGLRPVVPGKKGWIRSGISWTSLGYAYSPGSPRAQHHVDLLLELLSLADGEERNPYGYGYYGSGQRVVHLDEFRSRRVWDVLAEAQEAGLPLVQSTGHGGGTTGAVLGASRSLRCRPTAAPGVGERRRGDRSRQVDHDRPSGPRRRMVGNDGAGDLEGPGHTAARAHDPAGGRECDSGTGRSGDRHSRR